MNREPVPANPPLSFRLTELRNAERYVAQLGLEPATVSLFGVGFYSGGGELGGRTIIPIHDAGAMLIGYAGCSLSDGTKREWLFMPPHFDPRLDLYNLHRALAVGSRAVAVVEDFFDCMKVSQAGFPAVVALMADQMSEEQERLLIGRFDRILLLLDGDDRGWLATQNCIRRLATQVFVRAAILPSNRRPIDLSEKELCSIIGL